jgi:hypothetical protein
MDPDDWNNEILSGFIFIAALAVVIFLHFHR